MSLTYKEAGVDIEAGEKSVQKIKEMIRQTFRPEVLTDIGLFGGMFRADFGTFKKPVLVSTVDGVGTKLKVAFLMNRHNTIGEDLVNHCVNDILTTGANPLFFLDYLAMGNVHPDRVAEIVSGFVRGCREAGCALIGGETAEMADFYPFGEYDVAGTLIGIVEESGIITGKNISPGDVLLGLSSNGLHTNGYTLARKVLFEQAGLTVDTYLKELQQTVGEALLAVHRSYLKAVRPLLEKFKLKGIAHITGGGIIGNLSRIVPKGRSIRINWQSWERPAIFKLIQKLGSVPEEDMRRTFNLGVGMILIVESEEADSVSAFLQSAGEAVRRIGEIRS
ncbi:phosphoribosylformylglycinamidine cyclo-ligase [bacterium BMS3Abin05]|nr:phosphoribosylformylglycinamidine cyclo-ligase [bacterium BMS3Abin05]GBE28964.1 phosphoribosylformylglycinamidine cyclo-ligase [bacterium BMS3Bbin03]HDZ11531.1 phosphoribosylformylglycinamidine cyclo-ligase [Bacteroidota bacterium]